MRSRSFREEFLQLVRNDEIHIRLFSLHLYLLTEKLKSAHVPISQIRDFLSLKKTLLILNSRRFPRNFLYHSYSAFHSHLPEELFFEDFSTFFKKANSQTSKAFSTAFEQIDTLEDENQTMKIMQEVILR